MQLISIKKYHLPFTFISKFWKFNFVTNNFNVFFKIVFPIIIPNSFLFISWKITSKHSVTFLNSTWVVISLKVPGNHDFDDGSDQTHHYLRKISNGTKVVISACIKQHSQILTKKLVLRMIKCVKRNCSVYEKHTFYHYQDQYFVEFRPGGIWMDWQN